MIHQSSAVLYQEHSWQEKMLALSEELLAVEKKRAMGTPGYTLDELDAYLDDVIAGV